MADTHSTERLTLEGMIGTKTLDAEAIKAIRYALIVGLDSFGEIERVRNYAGFMGKHKDPLPDDAIPAHPTGSDETIGAFACALAYLN